MCLLIVRLEIEVNKPKRGGSLLKLDLVKTARQELALSKLTLSDLIFFVGVAPQR